MEPNFCPCILHFVPVNRMSWEELQVGRSLLGAIQSQTKVGLSTKNRRVTSKAPTKICTSIWDEFLTS